MTYAEKDFPRPQVYLHSHNASVLFSTTKPKYGHLHRNSKTQKPRKFHPIKKQPNPHGVTPIWRHVYATCTKTNVKERKKERKHHTCNPQHGIMSTNSHGAHSSTTLGLFCIRGGEPWGEMILGGQNRDHDEFHNICQRLWSLVKGVVWSGLRSRRRVFVVIFPTISHYSHLERKKKMHLK